MFEYYKFCYGNLILVKLEETFKIWLMYFSHKPPHFAISSFCKLCNFK